MKLPLNFYEQLREKIKISDIVGKKVSLIRKRMEYVGLCPFHQEKSPSFTVNDIKRFYHCFGCGAHGDLIKFVSDTQGLSYKEAAVKIAEENNIAIPRISFIEEQEYQEFERLHQLLKFAQEFFVTQLDKEVISYLKMRNLTQDTVKEFGIGYISNGTQLEKFLYDKGFSITELVKSGLFGKKEDGKLYPIFNKRIMFPIKNIFNKIIAFGGRSVNDSLPKYINSPETALFKKSEVTFGQNLANKFLYKDNYAILVEGYLDVIALHQAGFKQAVASLGTAVTQGHLQQLWKCCTEIIICLDSDSAGKRAADKIIKMVLPEINIYKLVSFIELPSGQDPDNFLTNNGKEAFSKYLNNRITLSEKIWHNEYDGRNFANAESRAILESKLNDYCITLQDKNLRNNFRRYFNKMMWENVFCTNRISKNAYKQHISPEAKKFINYSELEFLEHTICAFILHFPQIIIDNIDELIGIKLNNAKLNEFKEWLIDNAQQHHHEKALLPNPKNSRFCEIFELLSSQKNLFLHEDFEKKDHANNTVFFNQLCKTHYLFTLKSEYADLLRSKDVISETRLESYLKEIRKISVDLQNLSEILRD
ncbi:MAG: DNA primase [Rickettsiaceae bacterium]|nr:DNA primase [Rickettsiaceae bacterium]